MKMTMAMTMMMMVVMMMVIMMIKIVMNAIVVAMMAMTKMATIFFLSTQQLAQLINYARLQANEAKPQPRR